MIAKRIANASQVRFRSDSHPNRPSRPVPTRPDPSRPIYLTVVCGVSGSNRIRSHRYLPGRIGFGVDE